MKSVTAVLALLPFLAVAPCLCRAAEPTRQEIGRARSADVMPFDLSATTHVFTKTSTGGVQRVVAKDAGNKQQIELIRTHLKDIADEFSRGNYSRPAHVHGIAMPGLNELQASPAGDLKTVYRDITLGAEIRYSSESPKTIAAVHAWFNAQLADHGREAMSGHDHSMHHPN